MVNKLKLRSQSAEFLVFEHQKSSKGVEARFEKGDLWLTQAAMAELYDCTSDNIGLHLKNLYADFEIDGSTTEVFSVVRTEGDRQVERALKYYNLDAVIAVGYRVSSDRAIQFRRWATQVLKRFVKMGYVIDKKRMENGTFFDEDYFESLLEEIREIRLSERRFYQKITDIYATSIDYDPKSPTSQKFFARVQNKMHYAVSGETAAEIIYHRADAEKQHMGLSTWRRAPDGKILPSDVVVAKNYLSKPEIDDLARIVSAFLDLAESRARRNLPMTMEDWATRIDKFLLADDRAILEHAGGISRQTACDKALSEFNKYRVRQDLDYQSDFDKMLKEITD